MPWRTSTTDPLRIDAVTVPGTNAQIGMTICPGKTDPHGRHGAWHRDLATDITVIKNWGAHTLISLIENHEFERLDVTGLGEAAEAHGLTWRHWPIRDGDVPDKRFDRCWATTIDTIASDLQAGRSIVLHCMGGLGRTGTVAALLLRHFGLPAREAVDRLRTARPGAIETESQLNYVLSATPGGPLDS